MNQVGIRGIWRDGESCALCQVSLCQTVSAHVVAIGSTTDDEHHRHESHERIDIFCNFHSFLVFIVMTLFPSGILLVDMSRECNLTVGNLEESTLGADVVLYVSASDGGWHLVVVNGNRVA